MTLFDDMIDVGNINGSSNSSILEISGNIDINTPPISIAILV